jgi:hypothetical protein
MVSTCSADKLSLLNAWQFSITEMCEQVLRFVSADLQVVTSDLTFRILILQTANTPCWWPSLGYLADMSTCVRIFIYVKPLYVVSLLCDNIVYVCACLRSRIMSFVRVLILYKSLTDLNPITECGPTWCRRIDLTFRSWRAWKVWEYLLCIYGNVERISA